MLKIVKRVLIVKLEWNKLQWETTAAVTYKTVGKLCFVTISSADMNNVSLTLICRPHKVQDVLSDKPTRLLFDFERWANIKRYLLDDKVRVALKLRDRRKG